MDSALRYSKDVVLTCNNFVGRRYDECIDTGCPPGPYGRQWIVTMKILSFHFFIADAGPVVKGHITLNNVLQQEAVTQPVNIHVARCCTKWICGHSLSNILFYILRILNVGCRNAVCFTQLEVRWSAINKLMPLVPVLNYHWTGMLTMKKISLVIKIH